MNNNNSGRWCRIVERVRNELAERELSADELMEDRMRRIDAELESGEIEEIEPVDPVAFRAGCWRGVAVSLCEQLSHEFPEFRSNWNTLRHVFESTSEEAVLCECVGVLNQDMSEDALADRLGALADIYGKHKRKEHKTLLQIAGGFSARENANTFESKDFDQYSNIVDQLEKILVENGFNALEAETKRLAIHLQNARISKHWWDNTLDSSIRDVAKTCSDLKENRIEALVEFLHIVGQHHFNHRDIKDAAVYFDMETTLLLAQDFLDVPKLISALLGLSMTTIWTEDYIRWSPTFESALLREEVQTETEEYDDVPVAYGLCLFVLGHCYLFGGRHEKAIDPLTQALDILRNESHPNVAEMSAIAMNNLGYSHFQQGKFDEAKVFFRDAVEMSKKKIDIATAQKNLAAVLFKLGEIPEADKLHGAACQAFEMLLKVDDRLLAVVRDKWSVLKLTPPREMAQAVSA